MTTASDRLRAALQSIGAPPSRATQAEKKRYSERMSAAIAQALGAELQQRGMKSARPTAPGEGSRTGAERRIAGGIGAKKVDVTWATEESGLLLAISVKTINFPSFQKNLTNRRADMLVEAVTLHKRFPYAVVAGLLFFPEDANDDDTPRRHSTFVNAHALLSMFTGRGDPAGRDEQLEAFYIALHGSNYFKPTVRFYQAGRPEEEVGLEEILDSLVSTVVQRNPDLYGYRDGCVVLKSTGKLPAGTRRTHKTSLEEAPKVAKAKRAKAPATAQLAPELFVFESEPPPKGRRRSSRGEE